MDDYLTNGIELEYSNNKCIKEEQQEADEKSVNAAEDQQEENKEAVNVAEDQQEENKEALNAAEDQQEENKEAVNAAEDQQEENKEAVNVAADQQEVNNGSIYGIQHKQQEVEESINAGGDQQKKDEKSINGGQDPRDDKQDIMKTVPTTRKGVDDYLHSDATSNVMPHFYTEQNHPSANKRQRFPPNKVREVGYEQYSYEVITTQPAILSQRPEDLQASPAADYTDWSIVNACCCCFILGVIALIYSRQVVDANSKGRFAKAQQKSKISRVFNFVATGIGVIVYVLSLIRYTTH